MRVLDTFKIYINDSEENRVQQILNEINSMRGADKFSDEQKLEAAKKKAAYKLQKRSQVMPLILQGLLLLRSSKRWTYSLTLKLEEIELP